MADLNATSSISGERLVDRVLAPTTLGALTRVRLRASRAGGERPGSTRVRHRSDRTGSELERFAPYAPGDDLRHVDWSAYARLGELLTRRFVAEREVPVWILIDTSGSMGPAGPGSKIDLAAAVATVLGVVCLAGGDRVSVGLLPGFGGPSTGGRVSIGPLRGRRSIHSMGSFLRAIEPAGTDVLLQPGIERVLPRERGGLVFLLSDFLRPLRDVAEAFDFLAARGAEVKLVQTLSREDLDPAWLRGCDRLVDRETGEEIEIDAHADTLKAYERALTTHMRRLRRTALERGIAASLAVTDRTLEHFLGSELPQLGLSLVR